MTVSEVRPPESWHGADALALLSGALTGRARKTVAGFYLGRAAWRVGKQWADRARTANSYTVTVDGGDAVYAALQAWIVDRTPTERRRSLVAATGRSDMVMDDSPGGRTPERVVRVSYDGRKPQTVSVGGHDVRVEVSLPEWISQAANVDASRFRDLMRVTLTCPDQEARDAVLGLLHELANAGTVRPLRLAVCGPWGSWRRREHPTRDLATVVLKEGQAERVSADLGRFLSAESAYRNLGQPWHRGYLFHGPPGTGKTSLARALSTEHRLDLYYMPLSAIRNDALLFDLLSEVPERSMLLIEDVDVAHGSRVRDDGEPGVTMSGLLNALDGVATPHGMVSVLTTNDPTVLDPALLRRADMTEELGLLDGRQMAELAYRLGGVYMDADDLRGGIAPYLAVEAIARSYAQPDRIAETLTRLNESAPR